MESTQTAKIIPRLDLAELETQLQNHQLKIVLSIDTASLQSQLQNELAKAAKVPIQLQLSPPPSSSASSAISSFQTILPQFLSASGVG